MIRNFVVGLAWGAVVAGVGLGVVSQVAPMPERASTAAAPVEAAPETAATPQAEALDPAAVPDAVTTETVSPDASLADAGESQPQPDPARQPATAQPAPLTDAPAAPASTDTVQPAPGLAADQTSPALPAPSAQPESQASDPAPAAADLPPAPPAATDEALLTPAPTPPAQPDPATVSPDAVAPPPQPEPAEVETTEPEPALPAAETLSPDTALPQMVEGVTTDRLPAIGKADPAPVTEAETASAAALPIDRFARAFDNATAKPMFAIVLQDSGAPDLDRARLAALPFPVTFVIDPATPDAATAAQIYRAAGQEVVMLATGIPAGATAADLEQTFQSHAATLPEAVAALDLATDGFQDNRPLATMVVPVLKTQGRGLLTYDRGLNAADQVARRDGVRAATIFRTLDAEAEDTPLIRRYLDRAAFKAAQEGRVVVLGQTRDETVAAILEWTVEGRASSVALAPLTAVLLTPN